MVDYKELGEGASLGGEYILERWMSGDDKGALFAAQKEDGERVLVKLVLENGTESARQLATWQRSRHLRHANLLELRDAGRVEIGGETYCFAVFEMPDDNLATALQHGPLSDDDARAVLDAALRALRYLHGQGLVHGSIDATHIIAVNDTVKLATDTLYESDDLDGHAEDVRQLGELAKDLRHPEPLGEPLATIVRHATEPDVRLRWTLAEIARAMPSISPAIASVPAPLPQVVAAPPVPPAPPPPVAAPVSSKPAPASSPGGFPKWIFLGVAAMLLWILGLNLGRAPEAAVPPKPVAVVKVPEALPPEPKPSPLEPRAAVVTGKAMWRVIAFTYGAHDQAAAKAKQINERWPDMHATVFLPGEGPRYFLVSLGGPMTHDNALRVQRKARSVGLPRDIYVQNYTR